MSTTRALRLLFVMVLAIAVAACGGDDDDGGSASGGGSGGDGDDDAFDPDGVLRYGAPLDGSGISGHLAPYASTSVCDTLVLAPIYDTLTHKNPLTGELEPGLAESWEVVDEQTVELTLRADVTFHDGTPFDAAAVKAGLERNAAEDSAQTAASLAILDGVEAVDESTVRITLNAPAAGSLPLILSGREGMIVAPGADDADTAPVGAGPFRLTGQQPGETLSLERFDDYWNVDEVRLAGVEILGTEAGPPTVNALLGDAIDMSTVSADLLAGLEGNPGIEIAEQGSETYYKLNWNLAEPPFDSLEFRQAVNHAVDRQAVLDAVFEGRGSVAWSPFPETSYGYDPDVEGAYEYDPDRARDLLEESGVTDPSFTAFTPPTPLFVRFGEVIQAQLAEVGIDMSFEQSTDIVQDYFTDKKQPATVILWPPRPDPADTLGIQFTPGSFNNVGNYTNDELTDLVSQVRATSDQGEREPLLQEAVSLVVDEALDLPVVFAPLLHAHSADVGGEVVQNENCQGLDFTKLQMGSG
ncbi:MAG TPA: ABC transporter substrate-binding protein [Acidimicrobiales bacterium]|nr:ABC transporter substrate-binding protein [Acidimicrobiales bacterium]